MSTPSNTENAVTGTRAGVFVDTGTLLRDPSSNIILIPPYDLSDPRIQAAFAGSPRIFPRVPEITQLLLADLSNNEFLHAAEHVGQDDLSAPDAAGSDTSASTPTTDSGSSMDTSDSTITEAGQNARVEPLPVEPPRTPPRRNPFDLPRLRPPGAPPRIRIPRAAAAGGERHARGRAASATREGQVSFLRGQNDIPVICIHVANSWRWVPLTELSAEDFIKYREPISSYVGRVQSRARSNNVYARNQHNQLNTIHLPAPDERAFLKMLFNNHLEDHEKRRYIIEFSHTIIGESHCAGCLKLTLKDKVKCMHYDCPGMCEECETQIGDSCPICEKAQIITCPICKDEKKKGEIGFAPSGCGHAVCWACMGKAYQINASGLRTCPQCRKPWHKPR